MFGKTFTVGSVRGVDVRVDVSWILIALLITWNFWARFTDTADDHAQGVAAVMAVAGAAVFFGSILVHELAHALEAQRRGVTVGGITLFVFGGVTESRFDVRRPVDEFALTIVGPLSSFVLAGLLWLVTIGADGAGLDAVSDVSGLLAWINLALGAFNLLPGAPLDGGRVLRSVVWRATGDRARSVRVAARAGQVVGGLLVAAGVLQFFMVPGAPAGGLWLAIIGWFLLQAARAELVQAEVQDLLAGRVAGDLLAGGSRATVPGEATLEGAAEAFFTTRDDAFLVDVGGRPAGVLAAEDVRAVARERRSIIRASDVMRPLGSLARVDAGAPASEALDALAESGLVLVCRGEDPLGVLTPTGFGAYVERLAWLEGRASGA